MITKLQRGHPLYASAFVVLIVFVGRFTDGFGQEPADEKQAKPALCAGFPSEYSLTRPLLRNKPGAVLAGDDWQDKQTSDLKRRGIYVNKWNEGKSGKRADACTLDVPYTPGAKRAEIADDPTFGKTLRLWQTDQSDGDTRTVFLEQRWPGVSKCWVRVLIKYQKGFTTRGPGGGANSWKLIFGPEARSMTLTNTTQMLFQGTRNFGGNKSPLPNTDGKWQDWGFQMTTEWTDQEWWEMIIYTERLSDSHLRKRFWYRELTAKGKLKKATQKTTEADWHRLFGSEETGGKGIPKDLCYFLELGINRNKPMHAGKVQWWKWGPWEVIDGNAIPDPYGIERMIK